LKVEGLDPSSVRVPSRQRLRTGGHELDLVLLPHREGLVHVGHDDRNVLERAVVAARAHGARPAAWHQVLAELDLLVAQSEPRLPDAGAGDAVQALDRFSRDLGLRDLRKRKGVRVEIE